VSQRLSSQRRQKPAEVVGWLGGVQAQDYQWSKWSIGLRTNECTDEDVERAIRDGRIVRTWMFRSALYFVAASDLAWLTSLLAPGIIKGNARRYRQLELEGAAIAGGGMPKPTVIVNGQVAGI
jgi:Winged helix DNA-binding domain